jgi:thioredoxin reductase (NADPH)
MEENFHVFEKQCKDEEIIHYDVCIIGGGPSGLTSAIYSSRYGLHTALISRDIGGMANLAHKIENYPGFIGSGFELMQIFKKQAENFGTEFLTSEVVDIFGDETGFVIELKNGKVVHSKSVIIALGTEKRKLEIPGEKEFLGKGVSYCATCDANFFKNKVVAVIGGSNSATKSAQILSSLAKKVYIFYRKDELRADKCEVDLIKKDEKIEVVCNAIPLQITGDEKVSGIEISKEGEKKIFDVEGVFVEIGSIPLTAIAKKLGIKTDGEGYIEVNADMATNIPGIFAAGDSIKSKLKQVVVASAHGAIAGKSAFDYLKEKESNLR